MFSLANVLGKSQKYKVGKLWAVISCTGCQQLTEGIRISFGIRPGLWQQYSRLA